MLTTTQSQTNKTEKKKTCDALSVLSERYAGAMMAQNFESSQAMSDLTQDPLRKKEPTSITAWLIINQREDSPET